MRKKLLIVHRISSEVVKELSEYFDITYPENVFFTEDELLQKITGQDALLSMFTQPVDKKVISKAEKLKIIANFGVGYNNIDVDAATDAGIVVTNTPNSVTRPTAELCIGLMINLARGISLCDRKLRQKEGLKWGVMENLGTGLSDKILGIVGFGKIGQEVAALAYAFGMKIIFYDHNKNAKVEFPANYCSMSDLLQKADFVSLHVPYTKKTHHIISAQEFGLMKKEAFLINAARGAIVDEQALIQNLKSGQIAGAALDVFENEPHIPKEFRQLDNLIMVPHIGTATVETRIAMAREAAKNLRAFFNDERPPNCINCK